MAISHDHKPSVPEERKRIIESGGRVAQFRVVKGDKVEYKGPLRVWHLDRDVPGLAMTRSMADSCGAEVGVSGVPEIIDFEIDSTEDRYIAIGSDGIWEFTTNDEAGRVILPFALDKAAEGAGEALVREAFMKWRRRGEHQIDDITTVILFLK